MSMNSVMPTDSNPLPRPISWANRLWALITAPTADVRGAEKRLQAQLLSTLLLILIVLSPISLVIIQRYANTGSGSLQSNSASVLVLVAISILLICYAVSRTRFYLIAAGVAMLIAPLAIFSAIIVAPEANLDLSRYLVLNLLICGIMFSLRTTALIALAYLGASIFVFFGVLKLPPTGPLYSVVFLIIGAALILTFMRYRDQTEADRQRILAFARDELRANRELYRTLAQNLPKSAVLLYDHDLRFLVVEGSELNNIGYSKAMVEGKNLQDVFDPGTTPAIETDYYAALKGEEIIRERVVNGQTYRSHHLPVRNESGLITAGMMLLQNITEQKSAEVALRESEERYRLMAENSTDLISVQNAEGVYLYASPAAHLLLGYDPSELIGKSSFDFLDPEDVDRVRRVHGYILETDGVTTIAYRIRRADGDFTWMENASRLAGSAAGEKQIVTASRDISERMQANEALRRSEEQFRSLVASMDNLVFSINREGEFLVYHPMPLSIYDTPFDTDVFVGKHYRDVLPDILAQKLDEAVAVTMSVLSTQQIDYNLDEDGEEHFYSARISPMIGTNLQLLGATVVVTNVTEAVKARQRQQRLLNLEILQREIGMLFLETDDANRVIDEALRIMGTYLDVSRAYMFRLRENERLLDNAHEWCAPGVTPEIQNLQGLAYDELFPSLLPMLVKEGIAAPEHISQLAPDLYRALDAQAIQSVLFLPFYVDERLEGFLGFDEMRHPRKWLPEEIAAIRAFGQSCASVFERERSQLALIQARDSALRSAKLKSEFVSNMSHEIRTPMTGVIGMLDLLRESNLNEDQEEFVEIAHNSANRLLTLIGDILDFSKIEAGKVALETIPLDVRGVVTEVQSLLNIQATKKQLQLTTSVGDEVPARVLGDPTRLRQILTNLVSNSIKFTEHGSIHINVRELSSTYGRSRLRFEVTDTGIGIPEDRQALIFDSFVQADSSTTRRYGGAGLGLAICQQLVALMGGEINVVSKIGEGSTFGFILTVPIVALTDRATLNTDFNTLQVMVADEENSARYLLAEQLRLWGTNVIEASTLEEARALLMATARREEVVEILLLRSHRRIEEQEALVEDLQETLDVQAPLLVQLYDNEALASAAFDMRLRRPIHPTDLYQLLAQYSSRSQNNSPAPIERNGLDSGIGGRILVADDEPMNRQIVVHALEQFGYIVDSARNGEEVLGLLDSTDYLMILMDMQMPVMDGLEATRRVRARDDNKRQIPIIAFTASIERSQQQRYLDSGITAIIGKPFSLRELRQMVETWSTT